MSDATKIMAIYQEGAVGRKRAMYLAELLACSGKGSGAVRRFMFEDGSAVYLIKGGRRPRLRQA
jgi:hypothetical protein